MGAATSRQFNPLFVPDDLAEITARGSCVPVCMRGRIFSGCAAAARDGLPAGASVTPIAAEWRRGSDDSGGDDSGGAHTWFTHDGREVLVLFEAQGPGRGPLDLRRFEMALSGVPFVAHGLFLAGKWSPLAWKEGGERLAIVLWVPRL